MTSHPDSTKSRYPLEIDGVELFDDEDLECAIPGARLVRGPLFKDDFFSDLDKQAKDEAWARYAALSKPRKPRKPTLESVAKQAKAAGASSMTLPDGTTINFSQEPSGELNTPRDASVVASDRIIGLHKRGKRGS